MEDGAARASGRSCAESLRTRMRRAHCARRPACRGARHFSPRAPACGVGSASPLRRRMLAHGRGGDLNIFLVTAGREPPMQRASSDAVDAAVVEAYGLPSICISAGIRPNPWRAGASSPAPSQFPASPVLFLETVLVEERGPSVAWRAVPSNSGAPGERGGLAEIGSRSLTAVRLV